MVQWLQKAMRTLTSSGRMGPTSASTPTAPTRTTSPPPRTRAPITEGDFVLIDIWGRVDEADSIFYDITWTGVVGREPYASASNRYLKPCAMPATRPSATVETGVCRRVERFADSKPTTLPAPSFAPQDSPTISPIAPATTSLIEIHGPGAHLDNLETHDVRQILPNTCFSVEPGIYLPEFGVRSEIDMMTAPGKAWVTGKIQRELVRI